MSKKSKMVTLAKESLIATESIASDLRALNEKLIQLNPITDKQRQDITLVDFLVDNKHAGIKNLSFVTETYNCHIRFTGKKYSWQVNQLQTKKESGWSNDLKGALIQTIAFAIENNSAK